MSHGDRREIFERLAALERMLQSRHGAGRGRDHHRRERDRDRHEHHRDRHEHHHDCDGHDGGHGNDFEEKRIIDTIVQLVCENVGRMLQEQQDQRQHEGQGEKRIVDLIVRLVSEHVREIVATELDQRLGPRRSSDEDPSPPRPDPPAGRGGTSDS